MDFFRTVIVVFLAGSQMLFASLESEKECKALTQEVMNFIIRERYEDAFTILSEHWPFSQEKINDLTKQARTQMEKATELYGALIESEFIGKEKVGDSIMLHVYLLKFERHAIRWRILFYKPKQSWLVNNVDWSDSIREVFFDRPLNADD